ncbi:MAG TPA: hypothetical protein VH307_09215 [Streptosporangiaceae bacterium]|nr:hypothetical protein [Streptosporangiaceae bacterium]
MADDRRAAVSRTLLEGAARAPARPYLRNMRSAALPHYPLLAGSASRGTVLAGLDDGDDHLAGAH